MNSLPPRDQEQYRKCVDDNARFQHMINEKQQQLEQVTNCQPLLHTSPISKLKPAQRSCASPR